MIHRRHMLTGTAAVTAATMTSTAAASTPPQSCSLDPDARKQALTEFARFARAHLGGVDVQVAASFIGDPKQLTQFLAPVLEREAACCSFLKFDLRPTDRGVDVVLRADEAGLGELVPILGVLRQAR